MYKGARHYIGRSEHASSRARPDKDAVSSGP